MKKYWQRILSIRWYYNLGIIGVVLATIYFGYTNYATNKTSVTYQTSKVSRGTFVSSISASGTISSGNTTNISTKASGTVSKVYVKNGDTVKAGARILDIKLDEEGLGRRSNAWNEYLQAQEEVVSKIKEKSDLEIQVWKDKQAILDAEEAKSNKSDSLTDAESQQVDIGVTQAKQTFDITAEKFKNADAAIANARIQAGAKYRDYQDVSGTILATTNGVVNNLTLTVGSTISASTSQSTSSGATYASSQAIGYLRSTNNEYLAKVTLTEADVVRVLAGQKVTLTMDAHQGKTFTGSVLAVDTSGSTNSGVSSYPATIKMDPTELPIYPNMSVTANITIETETGVLMVPSSAISTNSDGTYSVSLLKNGVPASINIEIGDTNSTETIVKSGLTEGEEVVTNTSTSLKNDNTSSAFSSTNRQGGSSRSGSFDRGFVGGPGF